MCKRNKLALSLLLCILAETAVAADVITYRSDETPDPATVARVLNPEAAPKLKFRSLRLLPEAQAEPAKALAVQIQFAFNSADLIGRSYEQLDAIAEGIRQAGPGTKIVIEGHTDAVGGAEYNAMLSYKRAAAVQNYLSARHGINAADLRVVAKGKEAPLAGVDPFAPQNRRVEFKPDRS
jgi:outer membrane protein OmpA-like peptidoglycan-associated protein